MGGSDVDRHRFRARRARAAHAASGDAPARVSAVRRSVRRPVRAARDRDGLHDPRLGARAGRRDRTVWSSAGPALRAALAPAGDVRCRGRPVGGDVRVGHRPGRLGPGSRACHERVSAVTRRSGACDRARALVSRAADSGARSLGPARCAVGDLGQRAAAVQPTSMDRLCDRAAVRSRQRGRPRHRGPGRRCGHFADHARHPRRLRGRQAGRHRRRVVDRVAAVAARAALAVEPALARRRRRVRRDRFHRVGSDRQPGVHRRAAQRGQAGSACVGGDCAAGRVGCPARRADAAENGASTSDLTNGRGPPRSG